MITRLLFVLLLSILRLHAEYSIPAGRSVTWYPAGLDVVGGIPNSFTATNAIAGLHDDGSFDDSTNINNAISSAASNTVLTIPAGIYRVARDISMKSGVVLRGAKPSVSPWLPTNDASATTLLMTNAAKIFFNGGTRDTAWTPGIQSGYSITAGYTQGSSGLVLSDASALAVDDYIAVYQNEDSTWVDDKNFTWLGEDSGTDPHVWAQYARITGKNGNTITIDPPLYQVTPSPTGQSVRKQTFDVAMAGFENMRLSGDGTNLKLFWLRFTKFCWIKGVETYNVGANSSGSPHIWTQFSYANEYRRNYLHHGAGNDSGANYGIEFYHWNSRHKVEDNIVRETRHSIVFEGGGSGCVILYNYTDDNWESVQGQPTTRDDELLSEDQVSNHGAHPYMNLWEGNHASSWWGDYTQGSSSHNTAFRNSFSGRRTSYALSSPWNWTVVEIEKYNRYYNIIGNIIGNTTMTTGTVTNDGSGSTLPIMFRFGYASTGGAYGDTNSYYTAILHGNYDFVGDAVNDWADADHSLAVSLYYTNSARPSWFGNRTWPPYDYSNVTAAQIDRTNTPAGYRLVFGTEPPAATSSIMNVTTLRAGTVIIGQ